MCTYQIWHFNQHLSIKNNLIEEKNWVHFIRKRFLNQCFAKQGLQLQGRPWQATLEEPLGIPFYLLFKLMLQIT